MMTTAAAATIQIQTLQDCGDKNRVQKSFYKITNTIEECCETTEKEKSVQKRAENEK